MTLATYPLADRYSTTLSQQYNGTDTTIHVANVPNITRPASTETYLVLNPGNSLQQVVKVDGMDAINNTFNVTSTTVASGPGTNYATNTHSIGDIVIISDNFAFWVDIKNAIDTKLTTAGGTRTALKPHRLLYTDGSGVETQLAFGTNGQVLGFSGKSSAPAPVSPSVDIDGLAEVTSLVPADELLVNVIGTGNVKIKTGNIILPGTTTFFNELSTSLGTVTISTNTTLAEDSTYDNLTINAGVTLNTGGFRIFVKGTLTNNGTISRNGNNGGNGGNGIASGSGITGTAGTGGVALSSGTLNGSLIGGVGNATSATNRGQAQANAGGNGGNGRQSSGSTTGGTGGTVTLEGTYIGTSGHTAEFTSSVDEQTYKVNALMQGLTTGLALKSGGSGGGGAEGGSSSTGSSPRAGGGGGGGGSAGGIIYIAAKTLTNNGTIQANGGNGGDGGNGLGSVGYGGGGGGGGAGGVIILVYQTLTIGTVQYTGGTGGLRGVDGDTGTLSTSGANGGSGTLFRIKV